MNGRLHDDVEQLPLPRLRVQKRIIASLDAQHNLQDMGYPDVALSMLVRKVHPPAARWKLEVSL